MTESTQTPTLTITPALTPEITPAANLVANAGADKTVIENTMVTFDASASSSNTEIVSYSWSFMDGTTKILSGQKPAYLFTIPGVYVVTLKIENTEGNTATDTTTITVKDVINPVADAGANLQATAGHTLTFDGTSSKDNVAVKSWTWDFGDGTTAQGQKVTHTYSQQGEYTVLLTVRDEAGNSATNTVFVNVLAEQVFSLWMVGAVVALIATSTIAAILYVRRHKPKS
jgi:PKD repeat protein